jgi:hypothetical protein
MEVYVPGGSSLSLNVYGLSPDHVMNLPSGRFVMAAGTMGIVYGPDCLLGNLVPPGQSWQNGPAGFHEKMGFICNGQPLPKKIS